MGERSLCCDFYWLCPVVSMIVWTCLMMLFIADVEVDYLHDCAEREKGLNSTSLEGRDKLCDCKCAYRMMYWSVAIWIIPLLVVFCLWLGCDYYENTQKRDATRDMLRIYYLHEELSKELGRKRKMYLSLEFHLVLIEVRRELRELLCEAQFISTGISHQNLLLAEIPNTVFRTNLKDFMFGISYKDIKRIFRSHSPPLHFQAMSIIMRDVLDAVQYLHERHIYHLDLQPKNIVIVNDSTRESGFMAKVGGFQLAKSAGDNKVSCVRVGMADYQRPPECFIEDENTQIDGDKFDCWSIGITAYELFTGGMLTVEFNRHPAAKNLPDLMRVTNVMDLKYFVSAMDSRWDMKFYLVNTEPFPARFWDLRGREPYNFGKNYFDFVQGLLKFHPKLRSTVGTALCTKLMKEVNNIPRKRDDVSTV